MADPSDEREENRGGRPVCLDENKRRKIIALLANGSSRRVAARYVGRSPSTIHRTMLRESSQDYTVEAGPVIAIAPTQTEN